MSSTPAVVVEHVESSDVTAAVQRAVEKTQQNIDATAAKTTLAAKPSTTRKPAAKKTTAAAKPAAAKDAAAKPDEKPTTVRAQRHSQYVVRNRKSRVTGTVVHILDLLAPGAAIEPKGDKNWAVLCVDHSKHVHFDSRAAARPVASDPSGWCPTCRRAAAKTGGAGGHNPLAATTRRR